MGKTSTKRAAVFGVLVGVCAFVAGFCEGAPATWREALSYLRTFPLFLLFGAFFGIEWNELHFLERYGKKGDQARWALAAASCGAALYTGGVSLRRWPWSGWILALTLAVSVVGGLGMWAFFEEVRGTPRRKADIRRRLKGRKALPQPEPLLKIVDRGPSTRSAALKEGALQERADSA